MKKIAIIDYGSGNLHSTDKAFEKEVESLGGGEVKLTNKSEDLETATHIVLPGVGAFADCMSGLSSLPGMIKKLEEQVLKKKKPFLGICVGMQLLAEKGLEHGEHKGLGWLKGIVEAIKPADKNLKIPHMGWNELNMKKEHPFFSGIKNGDHVYFTHSFHMKCENNNDVLAETEYGCKITAAVAHENLMGTQFHPEKSQEIGLKLIHNFLQIGKK